MSNFPERVSFLSWFYLVCALRKSAGLLWSSNWDYTRVPCGLVARQLIGVVLVYGPVHPLSRVCGLLSKFPWGLLLRSAACVCS